MREREGEGRGTECGGWPMLGAFVETAVDDRLVLTFALSDVLPAGRVEAVVLGVDALRDGAGRRVTLYAVFEPQSVNVFSRCGDIERRHDDAEVTYPDSAVCVTLGLAEPAVCLDSQPEVRGFAVIDGSRGRSTPPSPCSRPDPYPPDWFPALRRHSGRGGADYSSGAYGVRLLLRARRRRGVAATVRARISAGSGSTSAGAGTWLRSIGSRCRPAAVGEVTGRGSRRRRRSGSSPVRRFRHAGAHRRSGCLQGGIGEGFSSGSRR